MAVFLEPRMNHRDIGEAQLGGGRRNPIQAPPLRVDQRE